MEYQEKSRKALLDNSVNAGLADAGVTMSPIQVRFSSCNRADCGCTEFLRVTLYLQINCASVQREKSERRHGFIIQRMQAKQEHAVMVQAVQLACGLHVSTHVKKRPWGPWCLEDAAAASSATCSDPPPQTSLSQIAASSC